jgi:hypothetical protein
VRWTLGTAARRDGVRVLQALLWLQVFSAPKQIPTPLTSPHQGATKSTLLVGFGGTNEDKYAQRRDEVIRKK